MQTDVETLYIPANKAVVRKALANPAETLRSGLLCQYLNGPLQGYTGEKQPLDRAFAQAEDLYAHEAAVIRVTFPGSVRLTLWGMRAIKFVPVTEDGGEMWRISPVGCELLATLILTGVVTMESVSPEGEVLPVLQIVDRRQPENGC